MTTGFELCNLTSGLAGQQRLRGITAVLADSGVTTIVGPSGSGKSSLLRQLNRLDAPSGGSVRWRGTDLGDMSPDRIQAHRREVGMVFQRSTVVPGTVADNVRLAAPGLSDDEAIDRLQRVALDSSFLHRNATELSGGEQQRVCLARTLATDPIMVLADEPTASLDPEATASIEKLVSDLVRSEQPVGWIWVTHDVDQAARIGDVCLTMTAGRLDG